MNTTGFIRGYMAKNMKAERFLKFAAEAISKEFGGSIIVNNTCQDAYEVLFKGCRVVITNKKIDELKSKSPYELDIDKHCVNLTYTVGK